MEAYRHLLVFALYSVLGVLGLIVVEIPSKSAGVFFMILAASIIGLGVSAMLLHEHLKDRR
jgi:hypothetical protein